MPAQRGDPRCLQARRAAADHEHLAPGGRRQGRALLGRLDGRVLGLMAAARVTDAGDDGVAVVAYPAGLVAQDARPDPLGVAAPQLGHQVRVGDLCPGHLDQVGAAAVQRRLGAGRIDNAALQRHVHRGRCRLRGDCGADRGADHPGQLQVEHRRGMPVGPIRPEGVGPAAHHREQVEQRRQLGGLPGGDLGGNSGPRCQLVTGQPQCQHALTADLGAHRRQHRAGQRQAVAAVAVGALAGEPGVELPQQRPRAGVDLDPVGARLGRGRGGRSETRDDGVDLRLRHHHRGLPADHVGEAGRPPQLALGERRRALQPGVAEPGE